MSADLETRAAQIRAAVADGHHTVAAIAAAVGLSPRRVSALLPHVPGLVLDTVPSPGGGPKPRLWADLPVADDADDEPWSPRPWVHPYRADARRVSR
jgi:hypothetical protein